MSDLNIGIVGCGHWGKNYVRNFAALPGTRVAAICDRDAERLHTIGAPYPDAKLYTDHREMLAEGVCDAIVVATIASTHYEIVRDALEAGVHVLAEKPLTLTVAECEDLVRIANDRGVILFVGHTFLYNPSVRRMRELIQEGVLGDIYYVKARRTHLGLIREDVNAVWDLAPHDISMLLYLLGEAPVKVQALGGNFLKDSREDVAFINLGFPSGALANIIVSWADSNKERYLDIVGSKARIVFNDLDNLEPIRIYHKGVTAVKDHNNFGEFQYLLRDGDIHSPRVQLAEPLRVMCQAFVDSVNSGEQPLSDGTMGRDVVRVLCAIDEALVTEVELPSLAHSGDGSSNGITNGIG